MKNNKMTKEKKKIIFSLFELFIATISSVVILIGGKIFILDWIVLILGIILIINSFLTIIYWYTVTEENLFIIMNKISNGELIGNPNYKKL